MDIPSYFSYLKTQFSVYDRLLLLFEDVTNREEYDNLTKEILEAYFLNEKLHNDMVRENKALGPTVETAWHNLRSSADHVLDFAIKFKEIKGL